MLERLKNEPAVVAASIAGAVIAAGKVFDVDLGGVAEFVEVAIVFVVGIWIRRKVTPA